MKWQSTECIYTWGSELTLTMWLAMLRLGWDDRIPYQRAWSRPCRPWEGHGLSSWVLAFHMGDLDWASGSWFGPCPCLGFGEWTKEWKTFICPSISISLSNKKKWREKYFLKEYDRKKVFSDRVTIRLCMCMFYSIKLELLLSFFYNWELAVV